MSYIGPIRGTRWIHSYWRVQGWWQFMRGHSHWGEMTRTGLGAGQQRR